MAADLDSITAYSQRVVELQPWLDDPKCLPIPWRKVDVPKKLKIGVLWDDDVVVPTPPIRRALQVAVKKLKKAGHEIVEWKSEGMHERAGRLIVSFRQLFTYITNLSNSTRLACLSLMAANP